MLKLKVILLVFIHLIRLLFFFFVNFYNLMKKQAQKFFLVTNLEMHQWSLLDLYPKREIFSFDLFSQNGLKHLVIKDDTKLINKIMVCFEKFKLTEIRNLKFTLVQATFPSPLFERLTAKQSRKFAKTARDLFQFFEAF